MKLVKLFICLLLINSANGQFIGDIRNRLFDKNFIAFKSWVESLINDGGRPGNSPNVFIRELRDIMPGYQELVVEVHTTSKVENRIPTSNFYQVAVISCNNGIIFYQVQQQQSRIEKGVRLDFFSVTDSLKNEKAFRQFRKDFFGLYNASLREEDLLQSFDYGLKCGYDAMEPPMRYQLNMIYQTNNVKLLNQWLASPNTELQIYAIEGLCEYKAKGYALTDWQKWVINIVKNKSGTINTCAGCMFGMKTSIHDVLSKFDLPD